MPIKRFFETSSHYVMEITADRYHVFPKSAVADSQAGSDYLASILQNEIDVRWKRNTHSADDPVRNTDPNLPYMFWKGDGGMRTTDVVYRPILVESVWADGKHTVSFTRLL